MTPSGMGWTRTLVLRQPNSLTVTLPVAPFLSWSVVLVLGSEFACSPTPSSLPSPQKKGLH